MNIAMIKPILLSSHSVSNATFASVNLFKSKLGPEQNQAIIKETNSFLSTCQASRDLDTLFGRATFGIFAEIVRQSPLPSSRKARPSADLLEKNIKHAIACNILKNHGISLRIDQMLAAGSTITARGIHHQRLAIDHLNACFLTATFPALNEAKNVFPSSEELAELLKKTSLEMMFATTATPLIYDNSGQTPQTITLPNIGTTHARPDSRGYLRAQPSQDHLRC